MSSDSTDANPEREFPAGPGESGYNPTPPESERPEAPAAPTQNVHAPLDPLDIRLNFNCMLYLFTELLALQNELVVLLKERGDLSEEEVVRIYGVTSKQEGLARVYKPVFSRFMEYYVNLKTQVTGETPQVFRMGDDSEAPAENLATGVSSTASTTIVQEEVKDNS